MAIHNNTISLSVPGAAGMGGVEPPRGRLSERLFRACKGRATRAARSVSRMVGRIIRTRSSSPPPMRSATPGAPRASLRKLDFAAVDSSRCRGLQISPGSLSSKSMPDFALRGSSATPSPSGSLPPIEGVRLKPGRSAGSLPTRKPSFGGPPALPPRPPGLGDPFHGSHGGSQPSSPPASPAPASIESGGAASTAPTLVFHRRDPAGSPITARVAPDEPPPTPPGSGGPLR
ncbi:hypothetical protein [Bordetella genomosp. 11]|uniref:hypothetical protein n=1 Tax=Bordetella genomosp. 11 TaxID=1416808 RepID=UPI001140827A|nr:hypothetical protein [Bordetella genomosp. 11]